MCIRDRAGKDLAFSRVDVIVYFNYILSLIHIFPGLSRLGSTISACVIGGMTRSYAVKYSLIVSVPAIIGATIVEIATMGKNKIVFHPVYLVGVFMAALAGYFTIRILMRVVKKRKLKYFALYCLLVGTFSIAGYFLL